MMGRPSPIALAAALLWLAAGSARAQQEAPEPPAPRAKVVVVLAGDPDEALRSHARAAHRAVQEHPRLEGVQDPGLAAALRGDPPATPDDGLERARAERRRLGWGESRDVPVLAGIGRMTGAELLLVIRSGADQGEMVAYDVGAGAFYEGHLPLPAPAQKLERFVLARADASLRSGQTGGAPVAAPVPPGGEPSASAPDRSPQATDPAADGAEPTGGETGEGDKKSWIGRNWPYFVAGALLAGTVVFFSVRRANDAPPQPVLRFRVGGEP